MVAPVERAVDGSGSGCGGGLGQGEALEAGDEGVDLALKLARVELVERAGQGGRLRGGEHAGGQGSLVGGLRGVVAPDDLGADAHSGDELPDLTLFVAETDDGAAEIYWLVVDDTWPDT
jgi:hypothetical protein